MKSNRIIVQYDLFAMLAQVAENFEAELKLAD